MQLVLNVLNTIGSVVLTSIRHQILNLKHFCLLATWPHVWLQSLLVECVLWLGCSCTLSRLHMRMLLVLLQVLSTTCSCALGAWNVSDRWVETYGCLTICSTAKWKEVIDLLLVCSLSGVQRSPIVFIHRGDSVILRIIVLCTHILRAKPLGAEAVAYSSHLIGLTEDSTLLFYLATVAYYSHLHLSIFDKNGFGNSASLSHNSRA